MGGCGDVLVFVFFFFFSSRRRHTRLQGDWSSDVCSSDLKTAHADTQRAKGNGGAKAAQEFPRDFSGVARDRSRTYITICMSAILPHITLESGKQPQHSIIWLHGLGADGQDFVPIAGRS